MIFVVWYIVATTFFMGGNQVQNGNNAQNEYTRTNEISFGKSAYFFEK